MNTDRIDFGSLVRQIRDSTGLTQEQLARELDVSFATVNGWENGRHRPIRSLAGRLVKLARKAGLDPGDHETPGGGN